MAKSGQLGRILDSTDLSALRKEAPIKETQISFQNDDSVSDDKLL